MTINKIKKIVFHDCYNEEIVNAKDNKLEEICSDGTNDIIYGRSDVRQIKRWGI